MEERESALRNHHQHHHVLVLPVPTQGHVNPMLQFSKRLFSKGIKVTLLIFSNKDYYKQQFASSSSESIIVETISYKEFEMNKGKDTYLKCFQAAVTEALPNFIAKRRISCVVYDSFTPWVLDIVKGWFGGIAVAGASFFTQSCAVSTVYYNAHEGLLSVPFEGQSASLPGLPVLERNDLPSFVYDTGNSYPFLFSLATSQFSNFRIPDWIFFNSFNCLEKEIVDWIESQRPIKTIGPTIPSMFLDKRLDSDKEYEFSQFKPSSESCLTWLDLKETDSVVYVSFGSVAALSEKQMEEIAWGLKRSNNYFLWVVRDSEEKKLPSSFQEEILEKGLIVNWSPQIQVLAHKSVGCFMTHCGWNSTVEAISLGVPMVAMPQWTDQMTNAKFVADVWKVGVRVRVDEEEGVVRREEIELCIRDIMEGERGKDIKRNSDRWRNLAIEALSEGGSSDRNIEEFISKIIFNNLAP